MFKPDPHPDAPVVELVTADATPVLPTVQGRVIEVRVKDGDRVKAGQTLFLIDPEPFQYEVDRLQADLSLAISNLADATELFEKNFASAKDVERAQASVDSLTAQLANARYELAETNVRAEGDGTHLRGDA